MPLVLNSAPKNSFLGGNERFALFMFVPLSLTDCVCQQQQSLMVLVL